MLQVQVDPILKSCFYRDKKCLKCRNKGHAKHASRTQVKGKGRKSIHMMGGDSDSDVDHMYIKTSGIDINYVNRDDDVIKITPQINDVIFEMEL